MIENFRFLVHPNTAHAYKYLDGEGGWQKCQADPGSRYQDVTIQESGLSKLDRSALPECLAPCYGNDDPECRLGLTNYGELKIAGPHLYAAWLSECPALVAIGNDLTPGARAVHMDEICPPRDYYEADVYLPDDNYRKLDKVLNQLETCDSQEPCIRLRPGQRARTALNQIVELKSTITRTADFGLYGLLAYLLFVLILIQANLAHRRCAALGQLRVNGLSDAKIWIAGACADCLSWLYSLLLALFITALIALWFFQDVPMHDTWQMFTQGGRASSPWLVGSLLLHLIVGAWSHWWIVLRHDPAENLIVRD